MSPCARMKRAGVPACAGEHGPLRKDETPHDRWLKVQESAVMRVSFWGSDSLIRMSPRDPTMASDYNPLDDLPVQIRRSIASPVPSHFSIVTGSPSPKLVHDQQVMSPRAPLGQTSANTQQHRQQTAATESSMTGQSSSGAYPKWCFLQIWCRDCKRCRIWS